MPQALALLIQRWLHLPGTQQLCIKQLQGFYDALRLNPGYKNDAQLKEIYRMRQSMFKVRACHGCPAGTALRRCEPARQRTTLRGRAEPAASRLRRHQGAGERHWSS